MVRPKENIVAQLEELSRLPDMIGRFIHIEKSGINFSDLPTWCPKNEMKRTGLLLHELFCKKGIFNRRGKNIVINFDSLLIIGIHLDKVATLVCLCTSTIDTDFFETASRDIIFLLKEEIQKLDEDGETGDEHISVDTILGTVADKEPTKALTENECSEMSVDPLFFETASNNLKRLSVEATAGPGADKDGAADVAMKMLLPIERALTTVIGPASEILLAESLSEWKEDGESTLNRINNLVNLLCSKIKNGRQEEKFRKILQRQKLFQNAPALDINGMGKAFARIVGPASSIIIDEILLKWQPEDDASAKDQMNELVDLLCIEIDDKKREGKFRTLLTANQVV